MFKRKQEKQLLEARVKDLEYRLDNLELKLDKCCKTCACCNEKPVEKKTRKTKNATTTKKSKS